MLSVTVRFWNLTEICRVAMNEADLDTKLAKIREVVHELPRPHFDLLKRLVEHLDRFVPLEVELKVLSDSHFFAG